MGSISRPTELFTGTLLDSVDPLHAAEASFLTPGPHLLRPRRGTTTSPRPPSSSSSSAPAPSSPTSSSSTLISMYTFSSTSLRTRSCSARQVSYGCLRSLAVPPRDSKNTPFRSSERLHMAGTAAGSGISVHARMLSTCACDIRTVFFFFSPSSTPVAAAAEVVLPAAVVPARVSSVAKPSPFASSSGSGSPFLVGGSSAILSLTDS
uniref:Uncharacterized protein n=1 Tax=Arundo donax TaxID=35708 RepID=A0A0A9GX05_ARUDO